MASTLRNLPYFPVLTGTALYLLTSSNHPVVEQLRTLLSAQNVGRVITALKWLLGLSLVRNANSYLSKWAGNDFQLFGSTKGWNFDKEIAVVTGGSGGFGALFATDLSRKGIHVVVLDITELPHHLKNNDKISFYKCDVTDQKSIQEVARRIEAEIGHPSILINNAGIGAGKSILETSEKFLNKIFGVNLFSHYYLVQAFLPDMIKKRKGHIISIASIASFVSSSHIVDYSCTKVAALAFHEGLRSELRKVYCCPEIKTTIVHPIWADTPLIAEGKKQLIAAGQQIINPQTVSDAVVKQVLACRSGQIILAPGVGTVMSSLRGFPTWLQESLKRLTEAPPLTYEESSVNVKKYE